MKRHEVEWVFLIDMTTVEATVDGDLTESAIEKVERRIFEAVSREFKRDPYAKVTMVTADQWGVEY